MNQITATGWISLVFMLLIGAAVEDAGRHWFHVVSAVYLVYVAFNHGQKKWEDS